MGGGIFCVLQVATTPLSAFSMSCDQVLAQVVRKSTGGTGVFWAPLTDFAHFQFCQKAKRIKEL